MREKPGEALAEELGAKALFVKLDVSVAADWDAAVREAESRFGPVSILVNNAGVLAPAATIADSDPADRDHVVGTNLKGPYLGIRALVPSLRRAGGSAIVNRDMSARRCWRLTCRASGASGD